MPPRVPASGPEPCGGNNADHTTGKLTLQHINTTADTTPKELKTEWDVATDSCFSLFGARQYCFLGNIHGTSRQLRYESVGISLVEVYERARESSHFIWVCKSAKKGRQTHFVYMKLKRKTQFWFSDSLGVKAVKRDAVF